MGAAVLAWATILTFVGLYGLIAFNTLRRTQEIGLRLATRCDAGHDCVVGTAALMLLVAILARRTPPAAPR